VAVAGGLGGRPDRARGQDHVGQKPRRVALRRPAVGPLAAGARRDPETAAARATAPSTTINRRGRLIMPTLRQARVSVTARTRPGPRRPPKVVRDDGRAGDLPGGRIVDSIADLLPELGG